LFVLLVVLLVADFAILAALRHQAATAGFDAGAIAAARRWLVTGTLFLLACAAGAFAVISASFSRRAAALAQFVRRVGGGDFHPMQSREGGQEWEALVAAVNESTVNLRNTIQGLTDER